MVARPLDMSPAAFDPGRTALKGRIAGLREVNALLYGRRQSTAWSVLSI